MAGELLSIRNLSMRFGGLVAVNNVSFTVPQGHIVSVIGPNGAGKTTVFNAVTGVYHPSEGSVLLNGRPIEGSLDLRTGVLIGTTGLLLGLALLLLFNLQSLWQAVIADRYVYLGPFDWRAALGQVLPFFMEQPASLTWLPFAIGFLGGAAGAYSVWREGRRTPEKVCHAGIARTFQNIRLFKEMSALENLLVASDARRRGVFWESALRLPGFYRHRKTAIAEAYELLDFVGLKAEANESASSLPYGHQRRLEIARALAARPVLLLLDEPAAGMNPTESQELVELIRKIRDRGVTVVLIEHHMRVVMSISENIIVLDYGNKIAEGAPHEVKSDPKVIEAYLGQGEH